MTQPHEEPCDDQQWEQEQWWEQQQQEQQQQQQQEQGQLYSWSPGSSSTGQPGGWAQQAAIFIKRGAPKYKLKTVFTNHGCQEYDRQTMVFHARFGIQQ